MSTSFRDNGSPFSASRSFDRVRGATVSYTPPGIGSAMGQERIPSATSHLGLASSNPRRNRLLSVQAQQLG
jgi:hypothetical protein